MEQWGLEEATAPVSPSGQYFNSSTLNVTVMVVFESEVPIVESKALIDIEKLLLPSSPRFSSIMVKDEHGIQKWKKVKVKPEDHVRLPVFPPGLPSYDDCVQDYLSQAALRPLPPSQPLWEVHIIKYLTGGGAGGGTMVLRLHHALGDGFTLMGTLFSCLRRADDPSLPLTYPTSSRGRRGRVGGGGGWCLRPRVPRGLAVCVNSVRDFAWSLWKSSVVEDDVTPVRSGMAGMEFRPINMSSVEFSLEEVRKVKAKLGGTINDVICGMIFYAVRLYIQAMSSNKEEKKKKKKKKKAEVTALVLLNTRMLGMNYQNIQEMIKPKSKSSWGNHIGFLHISLPKCGNPQEDPIRFVHKARETITAKKASLAVYLTDYLLEFMRRIKGPEVTARFVHKILRNTSMTISNLAGPQEKFMLAGHPIRSYHFMSFGVPQSLTIALNSYNGKLKVTFGAEKDFIDSKILISSMQESFDKIFEAAVLNKA